MRAQSAILAQRRHSISVSPGDGGGLACEKDSVSGSVSQRACVYCGARVVLNPITDACHIVHGPIGCAAYTWDIRGSLTSGSDLYRNSFSTDLQETDVIFGGAGKLTAAIDELMEKVRPAPKLIFVYATCLVGVIGDDVEAVCRRAEQTHGVRCIAVKAPGFSGTKSQGYKLACDAIMTLILPHRDRPRQFGVNILGDYNLAGEMWIIKQYLETVGIPVVATITGDSDYERLLRAPSAALNLVQCAGSSVYLAGRMAEELNIPYLQVSFFGLQDTADSLLRTAETLGVRDIIERTKEFVGRQTSLTLPVVAQYRPRLAGKRAAIFVGGGFKAISLIKQFRELGMRTV
ncbi:MAG: nitrogenase iron-molybdenum cofactor biosynthesis protein NifE, partial [Oscillospiraceae bacterium]|nr:nitrogenase iron-molybdenum cofactor biosynthesis protein NifE [Oscillospiraceae bacterium]